MWRKLVFNKVDLGSALFDNLILLMLLNCVQTPYQPLLIAYAFAVIHVIDNFLVDGDLDFIIEPNKGDSLCFNINGNPRTIFSLVRDAKSGQTKNL